MIPSFDLATHRPDIEAAQIEQLRARLFGAEPSFPEVPGYEIEKELGRGAFGRVYRAFDPRFQRAVALKLMRADSPRALVRIEREAHALARLSHPNVVHVYDKGPAGKDSYFIALEYVEGVGLDEWLRKGRKGLAEILGLFLQVADGLAEAHRAGLVHRDFKPANAVVGTDGRVRVIDFGLARAADPPELALEGSSPSWSRRLALAAGPLWSCSDQRQTAPASSPSVSNMRRNACSTPEAGSACSQPSGELQLALTADGHFVGTPYYAAPEQHDGRADARSDQFAYCVALFEAVYGKRPQILGRRKSIAEQVKGKRVDANGKKRNVPTWLTALLARGLSVEPSARFPSMSALADSMRYHLYTAPSRKRQLGITGLAAGLSAAVMAMAIETHSERITQCRAERTELPAAWSSGLDHVRQQNPAIARELAAVADTWLEQRDRACYEPEQQQAIDACLDVSADAFGQLVAWLDDLDRAQWGRLHAHLGASPVVSLVATLPDPGECLVRPDVMPAEREVWGQLLEAQSLQVRGDLPGAERAAEQAAIEARRHGLASLRAAARYRVQSVQAELGHAIPLGEVFDLIVAAHAAGEPELAAEITSHMIMSNGAGLLELSSGVPIEDLASLAEELGSVRLASDAPPVVAGWLSVAEGYARMLLDDYEQSERLLRAGLEQMRRAESPVAPEQLAMVEFNVAQVVAHGPDPERAVPMAFAALEVLRRELGPEHPQVAGMVQYTGNIYLWLERYEDALVQLEAADRLYEALGRDLDRAVVRNEIAMTHHELARRALDRIQEVEATGQPSEPADLQAFDRHRALAFEEMARVQPLVAAYRPTAETPDAPTQRLEDLARIEFTALRVFAFDVRCKEELLAASRRLDQLCERLDVHSHSCRSAGQFWLGMVETNAMLASVEGDCGGPPTDTP